MLRWPRRKRPEPPLVLTELEFGEPLPPTYDPPAYLEVTRTGELLELVALSEDRRTATVCRRQ